MEQFGLVFCGGGGRGSYQIGVWKALDELGITSHIKAVSGTSVGALNAALFATKSQKEAADIWTSLTQNDIIDLAELMDMCVAGGARKMVTDFMLKNVLIRIFPVVGLLQSYALIQIIENAALIIPQLIEIIRNEGFFSQDGLKRIIKENHIAEEIKHSDIKCYVCRGKMTGKRVEPDYVDLQESSSDNDIIEALAGSSCLPIFFQAQKHDGEKYLDGGLKDNCPIYPLYHNEHLRRFIVVMLDPDADIDKEAFPDAEFITIRPTKAIYLGHTGLGVVDDGLIDFEGRNAITRMELGYSDAKEALNSICFPISVLTNQEKKEITYILRNYCGKITSDYLRFSVGRSMNPDKICNAIKQYAKHLSVNNVLAIYDDTFGRTGKSGFIITSDSIVFSVYNICEAISFSSIAAVEVKPSKVPLCSNNPDLSDIVIYTKDGKNYRHYFMCCNHQKLKELLDEIRTI